MQVDLYGALTQTEDRRLREAIDAAGKTESYPARTQAALLAATRADVYSRALLQMQMANFHTDRATQVRPQLWCSAHARLPLQQPQPR